MSVQLTYNQQGMMRTERVNNKAFTLVELLVVISIIALLLSILMPSLQRAKYLTKRVVCNQNFRSQYLVQYTYATDNDGKFPYNSNGGSYAKLNRGAWAHPMYQPQQYDVYKSYIDNPEILICPIISSQSPQKNKAWFRTTKTWNNGWSGWEYDQGPDYPGGGIQPTAILLPVFWFANHNGADYRKPWRPEFNFTSPEGEIVNETPWPDKLDDCKSTNVFISHIIYNPWWDSLQTYVDDSHGGVGWLRDINVIRQAKLDNPLCYGDGHIETIPKTQIRCRAKCTDGYVYY